MKYKFLSGQKSYIFEQQFSTQMTQQLLKDNVRIQEYIECLHQLLKSRHLFVVLFH